MNSSRSASTRRAIAAAIAGVTASSVTGPSTPSTATPAARYNPEIATASGECTAQSVTR